ncbi:MAG: BlaI/MecI/CopY family transcriptional regulator [Eubacterium sp.]|jgi:predicted transcriptional regulator
MEELKLGTVESKFADIIWENEPISSGQLVKLCGQQLDWKKSTTYTMLKRLCERGLFQNEKGMVSALMTKEEFGAAQSEKIIEESFDGSLPAFIAAFASRKRLSLDDVDEIQKMIDSYRVEGE